MLHFILGHFPFRSYWCQLFYATHVLKYTLSAHMRIQIYLVRSTIYSGKVFQYGQSFKIWRGHNSWFIKRVEKTHTDMHKTLSLLCF